MAEQPTRRQFIGGTAVSALAFYLACGEESWAKDPAPKGPLKVAAIGCDGKGYTDSSELANGNICLALCDVDRKKLEKKAAELAPRHPNLKLYSDYRKLFEEVKGLDAVTISAPDHHHACAALHAMSLGIAVYVQTPMAHTVFECHLMRKIALEKKVATQMGNQGMASPLLREHVEMVQAGTIGRVSECHVWTNRPTWPQGQERPTGEAKPPDFLDWESWIGPAPMRPYVDGVYEPANWRGWSDFGGGALGDAGCHLMNLPHWALNLAYPSTFQLVASDTLHKESFPTWSTIRWEFPPRGDLPPCTLTWYDGSRMDDVKGADGKVTKGLVGNFPPKEKFADGIMPQRKTAQTPGVRDTGVLLMGEKGSMLVEGDYGEGRALLLPAKDFKGFKPPKPFIPRAVGGHMREFVNAVKTGSVSMSNFEYAGFLTELVLTGCLALHTDKKVVWDGPGMKATNAPELVPFIDTAYRTGWDLPGR